MRARIGRTLAVASLGVLSLAMGACTTRTVVLTNTSNQPAKLTSTGTSDGWDYERTLAPGKSFELKVGANQPISMPGLTVRVR